MEKENLEKILGKYDKSNEHNKRNDYSKGNEKGREKGKKGKGQGKDEKPAANSSFQGYCRTCGKCEGCLVVRSGHGPQAEVAQGFGLQPLVELGGRHLEGLEEEQRNEEEKETGEEKQPQRNTQVHMHGWDDACKADLSHGAM